MDGPTQNDDITRRAPIIRPIIATIKTTIVTVCFLPGIGLDVGVSEGATNVVGAGLGISAVGAGATAGGGLRGGGGVGIGEASGVGLVAMSPMGGGGAVGASSLADIGGGTISGLIAGAGGMPT